MATTPRKSAEGIRRARELLTADAAERAQLTHSGGPILSVAEVAAAAVALVGSRRVVRTLPAWRGGLVRGAALAPGSLEHLARLFAVQGRRAMRRR